MDYSYELNASQRGYENICGIDEAGRGPLAGPVCAAAVILPQGLVIDGLNDSKKISEKKRELLYDIIIKEAVSYGIALVDEKEIDEINILQATYRAMEKACEGLDVKADYALIDGNRMPNLKIDGETIVKGDGKSPSIAAASILAKVTRDRLMVELSEKYPEYQFAKHKGYGTKVHVEAILEHGPCEIHRKTFLKKILNKG